MSERVGEKERKIYIYRESERAKKWERESESEN